MPDHEDAGDPTLLHGITLIGAGHPNFARPCRRGSIAGANRRRFSPEAKQGLGAKWIEYIRRCRRAVRAGYTRASARGSQMKARIMDEEQTHAMSYVQIPSTRGISGSDAERQ